MQLLDSQIIDKLTRRRDEVRAEHLAGAPGQATVKKLTDTTDEAVIAIWEQTQLPSGALAAVGEYGRSQLAPGSAVELILLQKDAAGHDAMLSDALGQLWSVGIEIDLRSLDIAEAAEAADDIHQLVTFLDARFLAGDRNLFDDWTAALTAHPSAAPETFVERLRASPEAHHLTLDDATAGLEPDLKEGKGGLWDLAAIGWIEKITGEKALAVNQARLHEAADRLHQARCELHWYTGRNTDILEVHYQKPVAESLMPDETPGFPETELMRSLYRCCREVAFALDCLLDPQLPQAPEITAISQLSGDGPWPREVLDAFLGILAGGQRSLPLLRALDATGALTRAIPQWQDIRCLPQRNIYHRFAVDFHCIQTVAAMCTLTENPHEFTRTIAAQTFTENKQTLLLGALLHDIGKGGAEDHSLRGQSLARSALQRMGIGHSGIDDVVWLVANHLLLSQIATKRDIGDERLIVDTADRIGSRKRLRLLFLLSVADAQATGPEAWSAWKATLVSRLFERVDRVLKQGRLAGPDAAEMAKERTESIRRELAGYPQLDKHLAGMPRAWLVSQSPSALIRQSRLMMEFDPRQQVLLDPAPEQSEGIWELTVVANDRPGLFSKISGALALHDLNVLGAEAYTREDGVALEVLRVEAIADEQQRFEHVASDVVKALEGRLALDARLAEKLTGQPVKPAKGKQEPVRVVTDNQTSDFHTVLEVHAPDRIGRLYAITRGVAELDIDIHFAKVATYGEDIIDTFYVTDLQRRKVSDPEYLQEIEKAILHRLETAATP